MSFLGFAQKFAIFCIFVQSRKYNPLILEKRCSFKMKIGHYDTQAAHLREKSLI